MNIVPRTAAIKCFEASIRLDVRCGKRIPLDTETGLVWICGECDIRADSERLEAWDGYQWSPVQEHSLLALAKVEGFVFEAV